MTNNDELNHYISNFTKQDTATQAYLTSLSTLPPHHPQPLETPFTMRASSTKTFFKNIEKNEDIPDIDHTSTSSSSLEYEPLKSTKADILFQQIDLSIKGKIILENVSFTIVRNKIYGLVGRNGIGKSTLLNSLKKRKFGIPTGISIYQVKQENIIEDVSVLQYVNSEDVDTLRMLANIGFDKKGNPSVKSSMRDLSGGWVVRASLVKAFILEPDFILLDEPTNMLDIPAIVWLERMVVNLKTTVIVVSHDREFLDSVCTNILHMNELNIVGYTGNYSAFVELRKVEIENYKKHYEKQRLDREHLQKFIDKFRANAKRASLAQSKIKILENMEVLKPIKEDPIIKFIFGCSNVKGTLIELKNVAFKYKEIEILNNINMKITNETRIVIVGPNGAGKSTLLKLLSGLIEPSSGVFIANPNVNQGYFAQHHIEHLDPEMSSLQFIFNIYKDQEECRKAMSNFGLHVDRQKIKTLSGGQKSRLAFATISMKNPNILLFDEPTNHLDMESIDGLARALVDYKGAVICVSHDLRFVENVFNEVWICKENEVKFFNGTIRDYKKTLIA